MSYSAQIAVNVKTKEAMMRPIFLRWNARRVWAKNRQPFLDATHIVAVEFDGQDPLTFVVGRELSPDYCPTMRIDAYRGTPRNPRVGGSLVEPMAYLNDADFEQAVRASMRRATDPIFPRALRGPQDPVPDDAAAYEVRWLGVPSSVMLSTDGRHYEWQLDLHSGGNVASIRVSWDVGDFASADNTAVYTRFTGNDQWAAAMSRANRRIQLRRQRA